MWLAATPGGKLLSQFSAPGLAELVEPLKAERLVAGSIPGVGPILRDLT